MESVWHAACAARGVVSSDLSRRSAFPDGAKGEYRRRRPEETVLYRVVRDHLATFLDVVSRRGGMKDLPAYVRQEFERYLDCGILANGFARVHCPACGHDEAVAFSCKGRGFCPSCMGRRMADTSAHLVDRVFPEVPVRQWVLSFPYGVRLHFARDCKLLSRAITIFMEEVSRHYERELIYAKEGLEAEEWRSRRSLPVREEAVGGAVTSVQRFGSSLNLMSRS
ncbi:MAG: transposase zinc-binding domain-containing protein [Acidobacteria bacterium]|nr:transposase zinc-binding domain-containing protein [Acidobacteriota bacterium]